MFCREKFVGVCVIKPYQIRHVQVNPGLVLSPMSGVTTRPFRRLIKELNPGAVGLVVSEFVSVEGMTRGSQRTLEMMKFSEMERPYCVQIFGYDVDRMRDAALMVQDIGADVVDINCGCPAPKVVKRGGGCELMRQPEHLQKIIAEVKRAISIPLTLKIRAGWDEGSRNALDIARMAQGEGIEALAIHGRTRSQLYRGEADWDLVQEVAEELAIPVLGSGDVVCRKTAEARLRGKVAGLFIGRASMMNPLVFSEIVDDKPSRLKGNHDLMLEILFRYIELLRDDFQESSCGGKFKQLASQMCRGAPWRKQLLGLNSIKDHENLLLSIREGRWRSSATAFEDNEAESVSCDMYSS
jgi:tRNA-dihydrouridine synthase B